MTPRSAPPTLALEQHYWATGAAVLALDEVGRGCLCGPVITASVWLAPTADARALSWVRDSKQLSARVIAARATEVRAGHWDASGVWAWALGAASPREIDRLNIRRATALAMARAVARTLAMARARHGADAVPARVQLLVDGTPMPGLPFPQHAVPRLDATSIACGLASLLAKDCRDRLLHALARRHAVPFACWASDVGYPSPAHRAALAAYGPLPGIHRYSYAPVAAAHAQRHGTAGPAGTGSRPGPGAPPSF